MKVSKEAIESVESLKPDLLTLSCEISAGSDAAMKKRQVSKSQ